MPVSVPAREILSSSAFRPIGDHRSCSFFWAIRRTICRPQRSRLGSNRRVAKGDLELCGVASLGSPGGDSPYPVPLWIQITAFVGNQRIAARAVGIGFENVSVATVEKGVEDDGDRVVARQLSVAALLACDEGLGPDGCGDVEPGGGEGEPELRRFRRPACRRRARVEQNLLLARFAARSPRRALRRVVSGCCRGKAPRQSDEGDPSSPRLDSSSALDLPKPTTAPGGASIDCWRPGGGSYSRKTGLANEAQSRTGMS